MNFTSIPSASSLDDCLDGIQSQTFKFFWDGAHPESGLPFDKCYASGAPSPSTVSVSGVGFGILAIIVATERGWIGRAVALERLATMLDHLERSPRFHGAFAHFIDGATGAAMHFSEKDNGGDLVETTFLMQGLICAREYFSAVTDKEEKLRACVDRLFAAVEWNWYTRGQDDALYWHWSPDRGWVMNLPILGWNEALSTYVLAAGSETHPIRPENYHAGWARSGEMRNGNSYLGTVLPLGEPYGGPLFLSHYSFCVLDPCGLSDRYCSDYRAQAVAHARINRDYCMTVPGYRQAGVWGLTASDGPEGYGAYSPTYDKGVIAPTASLSSFPFLPAEAESALRAMLTYRGGKLLGRFGFADSFVPETGWIAGTYLAIDQGPIVAMIENFRSGLLWRLFMKAPEVRRGLVRLGFTSSTHSITPPAGV
ncbi:glucoamylase family protein [Neorhizobium sp. DT-125]|uniref:glucoamylase family protein n=1 Tax=Neorhizobium sp. DT-125 TaxID=3396163 RepID=UPI003F1D6E0D